MRVLFVENNDSFSWNVVDRLPVARGEVRIVAGAERGLWNAALDETDVLVIGPGPLDPVRAGIVDAVRAAAERQLPVLGICLGHQAVGLAFGATLARVEPRHGVCSTATFAPSRLFPGFAGDVEVMRYHSLAVEDVASPLRVVARCGDVVMALEHETLPIAGVQFHPDSYATPRGEEILRAFFRAVA